MQVEQQAIEQFNFDVAETKGLRVETDKLIQQAQTASSRKGGRALSLAITKLEEAKMWLGKRLEEIGSELPEEYRDKYSPEQNQGTESK